MIGIYNYTVWLTYLSFLSACVGIVTTLSADKPLVGVFCLMFSGLCDAFDGKVASTKKDRTASEKRYGIQIDSLSDIAAFGILPGVLATYLVKSYTENDSMAIRVITLAVTLSYMLAALIRLAYYNVTEEERQDSESGSRKEYVGLPVTSAAVVFPTMFLLKFVSEKFFVTVYLCIMLLMAFCFLSKVKIKKPGLKGIVALVILGVIEFLVIMILNHFL